MPGRAVNHRITHGPLRRAARGSITIFSVGCGLASGSSDIGVLAEAGPVGSVYESARELTAGLNHFDSILFDSTLNSDTLRCPGDGVGHPWCSGPDDTTRFRIMRLDSSSGGLWIDLTSPDFDALLSVVKSSRGSVVVVSDDDGAGACDARLHVQFQPDTSYYIIVGATQPGAGRFDLWMTDSARPKSRGKCHSRLFRKKGNRLYAQPDRIPNHPRPGGAVFRVDEEQVQGSLTSADITLGDSTRAQLWYVEGSPGREVTISLTSKHFVPRLLFYGGDVASESRLEGCTAYIDVKLGSGPNKLIVNSDTTANSYKTGVAGTFKLETVDDSIPLALGDCTTHVPLDRLVDISDGAPFGSARNYLGGKNDPYEEPGSDNEPGPSWRFHTVSSRDGTGQKVLAGAWVETWAIHGIPHSIAAIYIEHSGLAPGFDPHLMLSMLETDGASIKENDDGGLGCDARMDVVVPASGWIRLDVLASLPWMEGLYQFSVEPRDKMRDALDVADCDLRDIPRTADSVQRIVLRASNGFSVNTTVDVMSGDDSVTVVLDVPDEFPDAIDILVYVDVIAPSDDADADPRISISGPGTFGLREFYSGSDWRPMPVSDDNAGDGCNSRAAFRAKRGSYLVTVAATAAGKYDLRLSTDSRTSMPTKRCWQSKAVSLDKELGDIGSFAGELTSENQFREHWILAGKKGDVVTVELLSGRFDPMLTLEGPDVPITNLDGGHWCGAQIVVAFPEKGDYVVTASSEMGLGGGGYRLRLVRDSLPLVANDCTPKPVTDLVTSGLEGIQVDSTIFEGGSISDSLTHGSAYLWDGTPARVLGVYVDSARPLSIELLSTEFDARLWFWGEDIFLMDDDAAGSCNARIVVDSLPPGQYRVAVNTFNSDQAGVYQLVIGSEPTKSEATPCGWGEREEVELVPIPEGQVLKVGSIDSGSVDSSDAVLSDGTFVDGWILDLDGASVTIVVESKDFSPYLSVGHPLTSFLREVQAPEGCRAVMILERPRPGRYRVLVIGSPTAQYTVQVLPTTPSAKEPECEPGR